MNVLGRQAWQPTGVHRPSKRSYSVPPKRASSSQEAGHSGSALAVVARSAPSSISALLFAEAAFGKDSSSTWPDWLTFTSGREAVNPGGLQASWASVASAARQSPPTYGGGVICWPIRTTPMSAITGSPTSNKYSRLVFIPLFMALPAENRERKKIHSWTNAGRAPGSLAPDHVLVPTYNTYCR